jgi:mono/diheme cytochrome c family protein
MRNFVLGVIFTLLLLALAGYAMAVLGLIPTSADATPPAFETRIAMTAVDASIERHAPRVNNPVPPLDENLIEGMKVYAMNCALCHGTLDNKPSPLEKSFYPAPPQFILDPLDDPEWRTYYAVRTGIRYTGMPAWNKALSEEGHGFPLSHPETSSRGAGLLEEILWSRASGLPFRRGWA